MATIKTHRAICEQVIRLFRQERERLGISKYELAARSGLSQQTIGYMEKRLRSPSFETAVRLADGLGIPLEKFLKEARKAASKPKQR